jgi:prevent-host-death family protein
MSTITAKQLKQHTGKWLKRIIAGEHLIITYRGKPIAKIEPIKEEEKETSFMEAWEDIEKTLQESNPYFKNWQEAVHWIRDRG